jgi:hypothetical protein
MFAYCISLDPGGTTGVALVQREAKPWHIVAMHLGGNHHLELHRLLFQCRPKVVVCESFENRSHDPAILASCEYIGIVKLYLQSTRSTGVWQNSSTGKQFWSDDKLKEHGLYIPGMKHARDAIRHYAYYRTFSLKDQSLFSDARAFITTHMEHEEEAS